VVLVGSAILAELTIIIIIWVARISELAARNFSSNTMRKIFLQEPCGATSQKTQFFRNFHVVKTDSGVHSASYGIRTRCGGSLYQEVKQQEREANSLLPTIAEMNKTQI
jgi:hypothetical protein